MMAQSVLSPLGAGAEPLADSYHERLNRAADAILMRQRQPEPETLRVQPLNIELGRDWQFEENKLREFARTHWGGRTDDLREAFKRLRLYLPVLGPILRSEGLPIDLSAVTLVESAVQPTALSPKGARGVWQLIPETARRYGLIVSRMHDDRLDVMRSTRAAAQYLRDLHQQFGDWSLALAAYNAGEQTVQGAINRAGRREFQSLSKARLLPEETRNYVPAVLAAADLLADPGVIKRNAGRRIPDTSGDLAHAESGRLLGRTGDSVSVSGFEPVSAYLRPQQPER